MPAKEKIKDFVQQQKKRLPFASSKGRVIVDMLIEKDDVVFVFKGGDRDTLSSSVFIECLDVVNS